MPNTAPILTLIPETDFAEQFPGKMFLAGSSVADAELDALNGGLGDYSGATLVIERLGGANLIDTFGFVETSSDLVFVYNGELLVYNSGNYLKFGIFNDAGGTLSVTFNTDAAIPTTDLVNKFLRGLAYNFSGDNPPEVTDPPAIHLQVTFTDGDSNPLSVTQTDSVNVFPQADDPSQGAHDVIRFSGTDPIVLTPGQFGLIDPDSLSSEIFIAASPSSLFDYFLNGTPTLSFTYADVIAGLVTVVPPTINHTNVVDDGLQAGYTPGFEYVQFNVQYQKRLPTPTLLASDDTGTVGDGITAKQFGVTITGGAPTSDPYILFREATADGIDNDSDGTTDEAGELQFVTSIFSNGDTYSSPKTNLHEGENRFVVVRASDGNTTDVLTLVVTPDTTAPDLATADDTGPSNADSITSAANGLTFTGTAVSSGATIALFDVTFGTPDGIDNDVDGQVDENDEIEAITTNLLGTTTSGGDGSWSIDLNLTGGSHNISATVNGGPLSSITAIKVDTTAPALSAYVGGTGSIILTDSLLQSGPMSAAALESGDFQITVDGNPIPVNSISILGNGLYELVFANPVERGQVVSLTYDAAAGTPNTITDLAGNAAPSVTLTNIANGSTFDVTPPEIVAVRTGFGGSLYVEYSEDIQLSSLDISDFTVVINGVITPVLGIVTNPFSPNPFASTTNVLALQMGVATAGLLSGSVTYTRSNETPDSVVDFSFDPSANAAPDQTVAITPNHAISFTAPAQTINIAEDVFDVTPASSEPPEFISTSQGVEPDPFDAIVSSFTLNSATWLPTGGTETTVTIPSLSHYLETVQTSLADFAIVHHLLMNNEGTKFLSQGDTLTLTYTLTASDGNGPDATQNLTYVIAGANEIVNGTAFDENLTGSIYADTISGLGGSDRLTGLSGNDIVTGGEGDDSVDGGDGNDTLGGGNGDDTVQGSAGNDTINGNGGDDTLIGGSGDDSLFGGTDTDILIGGSGNDILQGNEGADELSGGSGNDTLQGGIGFDTMKGGEGDDTYIVDVDDFIFEFSNSGTDTVRSTFSYVLDANLENLILLGTGTFSGTGNSFNNTIAGNGAANVLSGLDGADIFLSGSGADTLIGGNGGDTFRFDTVSVSRAANGIDTITDFSFAAGDRIDVSLVDANTTAANDQAFTTLIASNAAFNAAGQYRLTAIAGGYTVEFNTNSNSAVEMTINVLTSDSAAGASGWFVL